MWRDEIDDLHLTNFAGVVSREVSAQAG